MSIKLICDNMGYLQLGRFVRVGYGEDVLPGADPLELHALLGVVEGLGLHGVPATRAQRIEAARGVYVEARLVDVFVPAHEDECIGLGQVQVEV